MASTSSLENLSLCVYVGNTSSVDDQILIKYCSQFGVVVSCTVDHCPRERRVCCDFRLVQFASREQVEQFLRQSRHKIGSIVLDVKLYRNVLNHSEILNLDRKLFIGPVFNHNESNVIIQFYREIDSTLQYCLSHYDQETYLLIQFTNRQSIRRIIQNKITPNENLKIHTPVHPKELVDQRFSSPDNPHRICISGLTNQMTEAMLTDYFNKRASVISCHILSTDPKRAIIEFENKQFAQKLLDLSSLYIHGTNLSFTKESHHLEPAVSASTIDSEYNNDKTDQLLERTASESSDTRNELVQPSARPSLDPCGWASPPRCVTSYSLPIDPPLSERLPSNSMDLPHSTPVVDEMDVKPNKMPSKSVLEFVEQFQNELDQIKEEYTKKFTKERSTIDYEVNRLINDQRLAFDRVKRSLSKSRQRSSRT